MANYFFGSRATTEAIKLQNNSDQQVAALNHEAATLNKQAGDAGLAEVAVERENLQLQGKLRDFGKEMARANAHAKEADEHVAALKKETAVARRQIAEANARANEAEARAAEANERAEAEHLARVKLESAFVARHLSDAQAKSVAAELKSFAGERIAVLAYRGDFETWSLAASIAQALGGPSFEQSPDGRWTTFNGAGWVPHFSTVVEYNRTFWGIDIATSPKSTDRDLAAAKALAAALSALHLTVDGPSPAFSQLQRDMDSPTGWFEPTPPIELTVGSKPPPYVNNGR